MAPLENPVELLRKKSTLNRDQSVKRIDFFVDMKGNGEVINVIQKEIQIGSELKRKIELY